MTPEKREKVINIIGMPLSYAMRMYLADRRSLKTAVKRDVYQEIEIFGISKEKADKRIATILECIWEDVEINPDFYCNNFYVHDELRKKATEIMDKKGE